MKTESILKLVLLTVGFSALALIGGAQAQVVNVDINATAGTTIGVGGGGNSGTYSGVGAASDTGTFWNTLTVGNDSAGVTSYTVSGLKASNGSTVTGESLTLSSAGVFNADDYGTNPNPFAPALLNDYTQPNNGTLTFTIGGLNTGDSYNLFFYSQTGGYNNGGGTFTIGSTVLASNNNTTGNSGDTSGFVLGGNYVEFTGVIAVGGQITGTLDKSETSFGNGDILDGAQIVDVTPEPSTLALIGLGALGLVFLAVRRRHSLV